MLVVIIVLAVLLGVVLLFGLWLLSVYNGLIRSRVRTREAYSGIDVQLKRRASLIPNLVETVKGYAAHERETLENVTRARAQLERAGSPAAAAQADNALTQTLRSLFAVAENYPELKANQNFLHLQDRISNVETQIATRRDEYNNAVNVYNIQIQVFPAMFVARMLGFTARELYKAAEADRQDVKISF